MAKCRHFIFTNSFGESNECTPGPCIHYLFTDSFGVTTEYFPDGSNGPDPGYNFVRQPDGTIVRQPDNTPVQTPEM